MGRFRGPYVPAADGAGNLTAGCPRGRRLDDLLLLLPATQGLEVLNVVEVLGATGAPLHRDQVGS